MEKAQRLKVSKNDRCIERLDGKEYIERTVILLLALFIYEHWVTHLCLLGP